MSMNLEKVITTHWDELAEAIKSKWSKLTAQDIKQVEGSYDILIGKIKKIYGGTRKEIKKELNDFLSSEQLEGIKDNLKDTTNNIMDEGSSIKDCVEKYAKSYLRSLKDTSNAVEENVVSYIKDNPWKILGTAAIICLTFTSLNNILR